MQPPNYVEITNKLPRNAANAARWRRTRPLKNVAYFYVHHPAAPTPAANQAAEIEQLRGFAVFHQQKNWAAPGDPPAHGWCIMYTWAVGPSGNVYVLNDPADILWNTNYGNPVGVATLVLLGDHDQMGAAQEQALRQHLLYQASLGVFSASPRTTYAHGECGGVYGGGPKFGNSTTCPGGVLLDWVHRFRSGQLAPLPPITPAPGPTSRYFPETGQSVGHGFLRYYDQNGGLARFGYPLTGEVAEVLGDGHTYTVQYFERARFEWHTESGTGVVILGLVGAELLRARGVGVGSAALDPSFAAFYPTMGGLSQLGAPVRPAELEALSDGHTYKVQYCERARLEEHGAAGPLLGLVGAELLGVRSGPAGAGAGH
jgi:hypothetical protein